MSCKDLEARVELLETIVQDLQGRTKTFVESIPPGAGAGDVIQLWLQSHATVNTAELSSITGYSRGAIVQALHRMVRAGKLHRVQVAVYSRSDATR